jgi:hypothetical protein
VKKAANNYGIVGVEYQDESLEDVWYVLRYDIDHNMVIMTYYDQDLPLEKQKPIRKIVKRTYANSAPRAAFSTVLDNFRAELEDKTMKIPYQPVKVYEKPMDKKWDLTDISNNITRMPDDFRRFIFSVDDANTKIKIRSFVRKRDIEEYGLNTHDMNMYLAGLKDFLSNERGAGW